ncbi:MAG: EVE domain-containing protein [Gammaproteobacteria bacterium]|jgi:predicted RNA-binding protein with PUA-like domain|nr:EVE domain-containing protein [Gammaproteobacteria bacterium]
MSHWLFKSEPTEFSIDDLAARPGQTEPWDGVRNYQARNLLRDAMRVGDLGFFYHSSCAEPGVVGIVRVASPARPDPTQFERGHRHEDPASDPASPRWWLVDVAFERKLTRVIPLAELKGHRGLAGMPLLRKGNRLSVMPVSDAEWAFILGLE